MKKITFRFIVLFAMLSSVVVSSTLLVMFISAYPTGKILVNFNRYNEYVCEFVLTGFYLAFAIIMFILYFKREILE
jgi:hypothetical protein